MDALVMCGGRGSRFDPDIEKPLFEIGGEAMVDRVTKALRRSRVDTVYRVTSPKAPATRDHVDGPTIETPGNGYVEDLQVATERVGLPVLTAAADLPLLDPGLVGTVLDQYGEGSLSVVVPAALKRLLGIEVTDAEDWNGRAVSPTGVNVVGSGETTDRYLSFDARLAVNVNRRSDADVAEALV